MYNHVHRNTIFNKNYKTPKKKTAANLSFREWISKLYYVHSKKFFSALKRMTWTLNNMEGGSQYIIA